MNTVLGELENSICDAMCDNDYDKIVDLVEQGANLNAINEGGQTFLYAAATVCDAKITTFFLGKGIDAEQADHLGVTPLMSAAGSADIENVKILLKHGVNVNTKDNFGMAALSYTCYSDNDKFDDIAQLLVANGADINIINDEDKNLLIHAIECENNTNPLYAKGVNIIIARLLRLGINLDSKNASGKKYIEYLDDETKYFIRSYNIKGD